MEIKQKKGDWFQEKGSYTTFLDNDKNGIFSFIPLDGNDFEKGLEHLKNLSWKFGEFTFCLSNFEDLFKNYTIDKSDLKYAPYIFIDKDKKIKIEGNEDDIKLEVLGDITENSFKLFKDDIKINFTETVYFEPTR